MAKGIMIGDDCASMRRVVGIAFMGADHDMLESCDGKDAFGQLMGQKVHVIISDANMPMDARTAAGLTRPIVSVTSENGTSSPQPEIFSIYESQPVASQT